AGEAGAALAAVLKVCGRPVDRRDVRLASLLCLEPQLLTPMLDAPDRKAWKRAVGADARLPLDTTIDSTAQAWGTAIQGFQARGRLVEDLNLGTWGPGTDLDKIETVGWPDLRAAFVVHVLSRARASTEFETVVLQFPAPVRQLVASAA